MITAKEELLHAVGTFSEAEAEQALGLLASLVRPDDEPTRVEGGRTTEGRGKPTAGLHALLDDLLRRTESLLAAAGESGAGVGPGDVIREPMAKFRESLGFARDDLREAKTLLRRGTAPAGQGG